MITPPSNFHGPIDLHISVFDNGFSGSAPADSATSARGLKGEPLNTTILARVEVASANDMPWLVWNGAPE